MPQQRSATCGKDRYATNSHAIRVAIGASKRSGRPLRVYRCERCRGWHLTKRITWTDDQPSKDVPAASLLNDFDHRLGCTCSRCAWLGAEHLNL